MIRINLLPQRKAKRQFTMPGGQTPIALGIGALAAIAAGVFLLVHMPRKSELNELETINKGLAADNQGKTTKLKD